MEVQNDDKNEILSEMLLAADQNQIFHKKNHKVLSCIHLLSIITSTYRFHLLIMAICLSDFLYYLFQLYHKV